LVFRSVPTLRLAREQRWNSSTVDGWRIQCRAGGLIYTVRRSPLLHRPSNWTLSACFRDFSADGPAAISLRERTIDGTRIRRVGTGTEIEWNGVNSFNQPHSALPRR
jgi:hypothetical protein